MKNKNSDITVSNNSNQNLLYNFTKIIFTMKKIITFSVLLFLTIIKINAQDEKKVLGIAPFTGAYDSSILNSVEEVVSSSFGKTKRFNLVGRSQMSAIKKEKELQKTEDFIDNNYISQTKSLGAQLLVSGNVTSVNATQETHTDSQGRTSYSYNSTITLDLKVLDVETGQVIASDVVSSKADKGLLDLKSWGNALTGSTPSSGQEAYSVALKRLEKEIDNFVSKNFPVSFLIAEIQEQGGDGSAKTILISGGSAFGLKKGDKLSVAELVEMEVGGKKIIRKKEIGELKITKVEDENFSICEVKSGGIDINSKFKAQAKLQITTKQ